MYRFVAVLSLVAALLPTPARAQDNDGFPGPRDEVRASPDADTGFPGPRSAPEVRETPDQPDLTSGFPQGEIAAAPSSGFPGSKEEKPATGRRPNQPEGPDTASFPGSERGGKVTVTVVTQGRRQSVYKTRRRPKGQRNRPVTAREYERSRYSPTRIYSGTPLSATALRRQLARSGVFVTKEEFNKLSRSVKELQDWKTGAAKEIKTAQEAANAANQRLNGFEPRLAAVEKALIAQGILNPEGEEQNAEQGEGFDWSVLWTYGKWVLLAIIVIVIAIPIFRWLYRRAVDRGIIEP